MKTSWADRYRDLLVAVTGRAGPRSGYSAAAVATAEKRLVARLPESLHAYYLMAGRHRINRAHNFLRAPSELTSHDDWLVFIVENQQVVSWGIQARGKVSDPIVCQTTDPDRGEWFPEARCSRFLSVMLCWQAVCGGLPAIGYSEPLEPKTVRKLLRGLTAVGQMSGLAAYLAPNGVVCVLGEGDKELLHVGSRTRRAFAALKSDLGGVINDA